MESPSEPRSKRQKIDKNGRFAALKRLRDLKGSKHKYDISEEVDNVYDTVDEREYSKRALDRAKDDWIDDDGTGYVEDGRDIFDDDDSADEEEASKSSKKSKKKDNKKRLRDISADPVQGKSSIKNLFGKMVPKTKKDAKVNLNEDDILADILTELDSTKPSTTSNSGSSAAEKRAAELKDAIIAKDFMQSFARSVRPKKVEDKLDGNTSDDELIDRILKPEKAKKKEIKVEESVVIKKSEPVKESVVDVMESEPDFPDEAFNDVPDIVHTKPETVPENNDDHFEDDLDLSAVTFDEKLKQTETKNEEIHKDMTSIWENAVNMDLEESQQLSEPVVTMDDKNESYLKFWFWDAWEHPYTHTGQLYLFGKIAVNEKANTFKSACIKIENIDRRLFCLPREYVYDENIGCTTEESVTFMAVYKEFANEIAPSLKLDTFKSKTTSKSFAFNVPGIDVPKNCDYLDVRYEGKKGTPSLKKIYKTIAHIFGTNTTSLETFLMDRKIKGPCWLSIKNYTVNTTSPFSWTKMEIVCPDANSISILDEKKNHPPPPLVLATLKVRTALNPKTTKNEVCMIACLVNNSFAIDKPAPNPPFQRHFCGFTRPIAQNWPIDTMTELGKYKATKTTKLDSERALLSWFLATLQTLDPDLIVIHDAHDCQLDVICDRMTAIKIPMASRLGRLRTSQQIGKQFKDIFIGRMICDVKQSSEELIKARSFDLHSLCLQVLKINENERNDVSNDDLMYMYESGVGITKLITLTLQDSLFILRLMCELNVLPLALQITNVCGNLMGRTLQGGRSERNEFLLLHAFNEKDYIAPDKKVRDFSAAILDATAPSRKKAAYSGGMVLDPKKGFYDKYILLMDFNSLYPSIIQEFNICFTTIPEPENPDDVVPVPESTLETGVLPRQIRRLVERRREVKKLMANPDIDADLKMQYEIRQLALKLTANSMYGCLGASNSRFFAQHLAALVTRMGREILMNTKALVQKLNFEVIYGDTDSIMINSNCSDYDQVFKIGSTIKQTINQMYKQIELDIDGVYKCLLLLKKKKYAAIAMSKAKSGEFIYKNEFKGLDIVRRDWSQISIMSGKLILDELLSTDIPMDERIDNVHKHLEKFRDNINNGEVPLQMLTITRQLTKPPKDYQKIASLPHVQVAVRMNATRNKRFKKGDMINYIICEDGTDNPPMQRAYHIEEINEKESKLKPDKLYYLSNQIHPVVSRMCEPIELTDTSRIAEFLGLDPSKFRASAQRIQRERNDENVGESVIKTVLQKYRLCERFTFKCITCKTPNLVASAFKRHEQNMISVLDKCVNPECNTPPYVYVAAIRNELVLCIRRVIKRFYDNWLVCDDSSCSSNTRTFTHVHENRGPVCMACKQGQLMRQFTETDLYNQLSYFNYMFDLSKHQLTPLKLSMECEAAYRILKETVDSFMKNSQYSVIQFSRIFVR